jgi:hypothetical protein
MIRTESTERLLNPRPEEAEANMAGKVSKMPLFSDDTDV